MPEQPVPSPVPQAGPSSAPLAAIVMAAGKGTRMKSDLPKVLHPVAGRPMVRHVVAAAEALEPARIVVVTAPGMSDVAAAVAPHRTATQAEQKGTGDAVKAARAALAGFAGDVLILNGDVPLITTQTLRLMAAARRAPLADGALPALVVLGFRPADPTGYGRMVTARDGTLDAIVEHKDADAAQRAIGLCNAGIYCADGALLWDLLDRVRPDNAQREYYLTDIVGLARAAGHRIAVIEAPEAEVMGVDNRAKLAAAERVAQGRLRLHAMAEGATLVDPETVYLSWDTRLGRDVTVGPNVVFGPEVTVGDHVEIRAFCHIEGTVVADHAVVGPFARLRPGTSIGAGAHIGNFVEIKKAVVEAGAKANHLSYIGDARIGERANVGAGTITCNYDGFLKHHTEIGAGAFIGSNSALVAPVKVGAGAIIGAGSVVTQDVADGALAVARGRQTELPGWAERFRSENAGKKRKKT
ncbi:MAG: bifunctional UDP-N-acetylglucosamine diphosphorylase/glucosamine-1-phosphate N-acetyltransferase GlmU [Alphaproteobacteria bacterium]|nr:bifunctional UDP-N-acetylglucosamine diphosphorylase/glucosamine-1-phosphate N-acetyltransferase GlmU [Alphaproteobacteria bacterium]